MEMWGKNKDYKCISTLTKENKNISYYLENNIYYVKWATKTEFEITKTELDFILEEFFTVKEQWYLLGASETNPILEGFGKFIDDNFKKFTPRHASAIAAILVDIGILDSYGKRPVKLRKL
ncbi:hypothetical protein [Anaeromicropila populeti]|uniref:Uncharacterized protein n=1 Tax=Anaeromicropila populeti TaxID=37658 RepID=A0A1I6LKT6_9FIRM|nr:hypothetical protein [Anaeromicropila populeti]SFS03890.1 hypothetical protein SAMN05661086_03352 [Anaeromicropila populeti]